MLLYLPLAHNFGRLMLLLGRARRASRSRSSPDPLRVAEAAAAGQARRSSRACRASTRRCTRRSWRASTRPRASSGGSSTGRFPIGREVSRLEGAGRAGSGGARAKHRIADRLVFSKVRERLGGRLRMPDLGRRAAREGDRRVLRRRRDPHHRGLRAHRVHDGVRDEPSRPLPLRVGRASRCPGFEVRIADDGEILVRSETVFQGYYKDPEATAAVLGADGWLQTGDIGELDEDGFLHITDRKKDILVTAGGKNVAPQNIENDLKTSKYVSQALVVGDRATVRRGADHARRARRSRAGRPSGASRATGRARARRARPRARPGGRRRRQPRALTLRAGEALRDPPARLHDGGRRGHADAQAAARAPCRSTSRTRSRGSTREPQVAASRDATRRRAASS